MSASTNTKQKKQADLPVSFTVNGDYLVDQIIARASQQLNEVLKDHIREAVERRVGEVVDAAAKKEIVAAVKQVLVEGWSKTDDYGRPLTKASLKDRIGEMLRAQDRYGSSRSWMEELVKTETEKALKGELGKEIEDARAKLRAEVDQVTRAKLNEALRAALGVQS